MTGEQDCGIAAGNLYDKLRILPVIFWGIVGVGWFFLRASRAQAADIRTTARTSELTPSAWLRRVAAGATVSDDFTPRADTLIGKLDQLNALLLALGRNFNQLARHVRYITRDGDLDYLDAEAAKRPGDEWRSFVDEVVAADPSTRKNRGLTVHLVVSLPANTAIETEALYALTDEWMEGLAPGHRRLIVVHRDTAHPHAHVVVARHGPRERFRFAARDF